MGVSEGATDNKVASSCSLHSNRQSQKHSAKTCLLDCLVKWLNENRFPDYLYWVDEEKTTFRVIYQHGNKSNPKRPQREAAAVWLEWDKMKKRHPPNLLEMSPKDAGEYLTIVRQRFHQAINSPVKRGLLTSIHTQDRRHIREFRITTAGERALLGGPRQICNPSSPSSSSPSRPDSSKSSSDLQVVPSSLSPVYLLCVPQGGSKPTVETERELSKYPLSFAKDWATDLRTEGTIKCETPDSTLDAAALNQSDLKLCSNVASPIQNSSACILDDTVKKLSERVGLKIDLFRFTDTGSPVREILATDEMILGL